MGKIPAAAVALLVLAGCGERGPPSAEEIEIKRTDGAKEQVRNLLRDPKSANFMQVEYHAGTGAVCGLVNSANGFGGMSGYQRFVSNGATVTALEEQMAGGEMDALWAKLCAI